MKKNKCCICGKPYEGVEFECDVCGWRNDHIQHIVYKDDEFDDFNKLSRAEAKRRFAKGLNKWGRPIKTK